MPEAKAPVRLAAGLDRLGISMTVSLLSLLFPTVLLLSFCLQTQASISTYITQAWQAGFWVFPGLTQKMSTYLADAVLFLSIAASGVLFVRGDRLLQQDHRKDNQDERAVFFRIIFWASLMGVLLVWVIPFHSRDLYGYINRGAQQVFFNANPYITTVGELDWKSNPMFHNHWLNNPCPYGFYYALVMRFITQLGAGYFFWTFLLFKGLSLIIHLATTVLLYMFAREFPGLHPNRVAYLYAWNPLILLHCVANGHNDALLAFLLLLALYMAFFAKSRLLSFPVLVVSVLTKYSSVLALPFFMIYAWRNPPRKPWLISALVAVLIGVALAIPYMQDGGILAFPWDRLLENVGKSQHSIQSMLARAIAYGGHVLLKTNANILLADSRTILKPVFLLGFVAFYGLLLRQAWQKLLTMQALITAIVQAMMFFILIASAKFHAWYFAMVFPMALLLPEKSPWFRIAVLISIVQLFAFTPLENLHILNALLLIVLPIAWVLYDTVKPRASG